MLEASHLPLSDWESFYVIVGSSAAALTGLQFVVIALGAEARRLAGSNALAAYATPTIVHFCVVLLVAAVLSTPHQTATSLGICLLVVGIGGLSYAGAVLRQVRKQTGYAPVLEDWIWHTIFPALAYAAILVGGIITWTHVVPALFVVAAAALLLLYVGIHNAWDAAVWMTTQLGE